MLLLFLKLLTLQLVRARAFKSFCVRPQYDLFINIDKTCTSILIDLLHVYIPYICLYSLEEILLSLND